MRLASAASRLLSAHWVLLILCLLSTGVTAVQNITDAGDAASSDLTQSTSSSASVVGGAQVNSKILIIARDKNASYSAYSGFQGYGIPFEVLLVPSSGAQLPTLMTGTTQGNYGGIVIIGDVTYAYSSGWRSALTDVQWQQLYDYQTAFNVRMVRLDVYPGPDFGTDNVGDGKGCCNTGIEQYITITNDTAFPNSGLRLNANVSSAGLWHYPAKITNSNTTWQVAAFGTSGTYTNASTAAVINILPNGSGSRSQMVWFIGWATDWNVSSNFLMHTWIQWVTRGLFSGFRRVYFNTQIDDVHLETELYASTTFEPKQISFRVRSDDLNGHVTWMATINKNLNPGSSYMIDLGHNGNGNIEASVDLDDAAFFGSGLCSPATGVEYDQIEGTPSTLEYMKPLGTGQNLWPASPVNYTWSLDCALEDDLLAWFNDPNNLNKFSHVSHTFSHENLMNSTYSDASKEIAFNNVWLKQVGIAGATKFSGDGLIPPAITGLHNGDVIKAWMDNGVKYVVGDNTRPALMNTDNNFWPLTTTVKDNGYAGLEIIPRWATTIYYNCETAECTLAEWKATSAGQGNFNDLLQDAKITNNRHLLGLHQDPFMFHQANLRYTDAATYTINGQKAKRSLLMVWVEVVLTEFQRLVTWPIITLKHDDIAKAFISRRSRDWCLPSLTWVYSPDGKSITGATIGSSNSNTCAAEIPVTFPGPVVSSNGGRTEQVGNDPLTVWVKLIGKAITFSLKTPIAL